jgi:hypothetical protein
MKKPTQAGAARLKAARKAAAKELKLPPTDWRALRFALLALEHEKLQAIAASDGNVDIDRLLRLEAAMQEIRAGLPAEIPKVTIEIIGGGDDAHCHVPGCHGAIVQICACCNRTPGEDPQRPAKHRLTLASLPEAAPTEPTNLTLVGSTPAPPPPISQPRGVSASGFHDQIVGNEVAPIKRSAISGGNAGSLVWSGYEGGHRQYGTATPDINPNYNSDGSPRSPHRSPY